MNRISRADYLEALERAEQEEGPEDGVNSPGPGLEGSEAEQLAAQAGEPQKRADGQPVGMEGWKRRRPLTEKQQAFVRGVIEGKTYRQAYREAYPDAGGSDQAIASSAFKLTRDPRIRALIQAGEEEQQEHLAEDLAATRRYVMRQLLALSKGASQEGSKLKSLELLGRAAGMWREVQAPPEKPVTAAELKAALSGHLRHLALVKPSRQEAPATGIGGGAGVKQAEG